MFFLSSKRPLDLVTVRQGRILYGAHCIMVPRRNRANRKCIRIYVGFPVECICI